MAHITSFDVSGLAGREQNYGVSLDSHINIFFGTNGSGKTSLLRLLHAAMFEETSGILSIPFLAVEVEIFSTTLNMKLKKSIDTSAARLMVEGSPERRPEERLSIYTEIEKSLKWKVSGDKVTYPLSHSYLPTTRLYAGLDRAIIYA